MIRESEILRMCRDIPKDAVGLFEIYACVGKRQSRPSGDGREVIVYRKWNRVRPVRNNSEGAKSAIELFPIVSSNLTMRTSHF